MNLLQTQFAMRSWLTEGTDEHASSFGESARAGLDVYQNNYRTRLVDCLSETFERVHSWLGDEAFVRAAVIHIDRVPPSSWTLDAYALHFPDTLASLYDSDPEVFELAWLDQALAQTYVAVDTRAFTIEDLAKVDWSNARLAFTPTLIMRSIATNAPAIWSALAADTVPPAAEKRPRDVRGLIVWRQGLDPRFRSVDASELHALDNLTRGGRSYADLCSSLVASHGEERGVALAGEWLGRWVNEGLIICA